MDRAFPFRLALPMGCSALAKSPRRGIVRAPAAAVAAVTNRHVTTNKHIATRHRVHVHREPRGVCRALQLVGLMKEGSRWGISSYMVCILYMLSVYCIYTYMYIYDPYTLCRLVSTRVVGMFRGVLRVRNCVIIPVLATFRYRVK